MTPDEIRQRRKALDLSIPALAREIGVSASTVWRWEERGGKLSTLGQRQLESTFKRLERRRAPATPRADRGEG